MPQPMISTLNFDWDASQPNADKVIIDIPAALSKINRKLYRANRRYALAGIQIQKTSGTATGVKIGSAMDSWVVKNSLNKAFKMWKEQRASVLEDGMTDPGVLARWADFKPYLHIQHARGNVVGLNPVVEFGGTEETQGPWERATWVYDSGDSSNNPNEMTLHLMGQHLDGSTATDTFSPSATDSVGLILAYEQSRVSGIPIGADPEDYGIENPNPYSAMVQLSDISEDVLDNVIDDNDLPPYAVHALVGARTGADEVYNQCLLRLSDNNTPNFAPGFIAPLGLVQLEATGTDPGDMPIYEVKFFMVPDNNAYGVMSEAI